MLRALLLLLFLLLCHKPNPIHHISCGPYQPMGPKDQEPWIHLSFQGNVKYLDWGIFISRIQCLLKAMNNQVCFLTKIHLEYTWMIKEKKHLKRRQPNVSWKRVQPIKWYKTWTFSLKSSRKKINFKYKKSPNVTSNIRPNYYIFCLLPYQGAEQR